MERNGTKFRVGLKLTTWCTPNSSSISCSSSVEVKKRRARQNGAGTTVETNSRYCYNVLCPGLHAGFCSGGGIH